MKHEPGRGIVPQDQALVRLTGQSDGVHRPIKSFVLRQGRVSPAQQRACDMLLPVFGVPYSNAAINLGELFGRASEKYLEVGFGMGETTAHIAATFPERDFLAIEVHTPGVGALLKTIGETGLQNVRIVQHDAVEVLNHMIGDESYHVAHIFFPDPWPKKRHHKRRLIQSPFVSLLTGKLKPGGYLHVATDWEEYAQQILAVLSAEPALMNTADGFAPRPAYRPQTKFEARGLKLGHGVWDIVFRKR
jgi:tRNA (guanine-N7-)-methyltransferase